MKLWSKTDNTAANERTQGKNFICRIWTELSERLRLRRTRGDTSEDDEGLPRSPCNSPTTTEGLLDKSNNKDHPTKSHSTCSDGSLLSMGSSEMDEDSFGLQSRHSSKLSLHDKRSQEPSNESETEWGPSHSSAPLNHSAAHHKVSIRPKRTHGAPRRKRAPGSVTPLPTTPEVNEDSSIRSVTPESTRETITELYTSMSHHQQTQTVTDPRIKCSSLPPGLAGPGADGNKLSRSRSNAGSKSQDPFSALEEEDSSEGKKSESSFFGRIFPRRSGKKKKKEEKEKEKEKTAVSSSNGSYAKVESYSSININYEPFDKSMIAVDCNLAIRPNALRSGPASRQRMQPIDIPASPDLSRQGEMQPSSPLQAELESHFKNRKVMNSSSPSSSSPLHFSISPPKSPWNEKRQYTKYSSKFLETREESKSKIRIAGLSSLQQRVLSLNDDTDNSFKSLTNLPTDYEQPVRPIAKSHSFKSTKTNYEQKDVRYAYTAVNEEIKTEKLSEIDKKDTNIFKSISLDSVKNANEIVESVNEAKVVESEEYLTSNNVNFEEDSGVTISGPSHKAIVNIGSSDHVIVKNTESEFTVKEQQISVTKIQVKRESTQVTVGKNSTPEHIGSKSSVPEFFSVHLNKIESNPVLINTSPKLEESQKVFNYEEREVAVEKQRKFSNDSIEVVKKEDVEANPKPNALVTVTPMAPVNNRYYKKHSESMKKPAVASEKPMLKIKSNSFEAVEPKKSSDSSPSSNKSSQNSLDKIENPENIVLRRKSLIRQKPDEEPELMKVFARRSLKLKDSDSEALSQQVILMVQENENSNKSRDSDKENLSDSSPLEERKKTTKSAKEPSTPKDRTKEPLSAKDTQKTAFVRDSQKVKEPLAETKSFKDAQIPETKFVESTEVTLRKPVINNKFSVYQRTVSLTAPKTESKILKSISVVDRPKTETWFSKNQDDGKDERNESDEIITNLTEKSDIIHEFNVKPKNFNQRKAEWEKRAQEALRKTVP